MRGPQAHAALTPLRLVVRLAQWICHHGRAPVVRDLVPQNGLPHFTIVTAHRFRTATEAITQAHALLVGDPPVIQALWADEHPRCLWCGAVGVGRPPHVAAHCPAVSSGIIPWHLRTRSAWYRRLAQWGDTALRQEEEAPDAAPAESP